MHQLIVCALHISTTTALIPSIARIFSSSKKVLMTAPFVSLRSFNNGNNRIEICELERGSISTAAIRLGKTFLVHTFIPNTFLLPQFLAKDCHWQTIIGSKAIQNKIFGLKKIVYFIQLRNAFSHQMEASSTWSSQKTIRMRKA